MPFSFKTKYRLLTVNLQCQDRLYHGVGPFHIGDGGEAGVEEGKRPNTHGGGKKVVAILREVGMPLHLRDHVLVLADCTHDADDGRVLAMWLPAQHQEATAKLVFAAHVPGSARTLAAEGAESTAPAGVLTAVLELSREQPAPEWPGVF